MIKRTFFLIAFLLVLLCSCASKQSRIKNGSLQGADSLANLVIEATNGACWDSVDVIQWTFVNRKHLWDRKRNLHRFEKGDEVTLIDLNNYSNGLFFENGELQGAEESIGEFEDAYNAWANDSYWLNPFWKFYDGGVQRRIYNDKEGNQHLLVYYQKDEDIGDLYDWTIGEDHLPTQWNLFVKIIPFNNFKFSWSDWKSLGCGLKVSTKHESSLFDIDLKDIEMIESWEESKFEEDPFLPLVSKIQNK